MGEQRWHVRKHSLCSSELAQAHLAGKRGRKASTATTQPPSDAAPTSNTQDLLKPAGTASDGSTRAEADAADAEEGSRMPEDSTGTPLGLEAVATQAAAVVPEQACKSAAKDSNDKAGGLPVQGNTEHSAAEAGDTLVQDGRKAAVTGSLSISVGIESSSKSETAAASEHLQSKGGMLSNAASAGQGLGGSMKLTGKSACADGVLQEVKGNIKSLMHRGKRCMQVLQRQRLHVTHPAFHAGMVLVTGNIAEIIVAVQLHTCELTGFAGLDHSFKANTRTQGKVQTQDANKRSILGYTVPLRRSARHA